MTLDAIINDLNTFVDYGVELLKLRNTPSIKDINGWALENLMDYFNYDASDMIEYIDSQGKINKFLDGVGEYDLKRYLSANYDAEDFISADWKGYY